MKQQPFDVVVLGSEFSGILLAMVLSRQGRRVAMLETDSAFQRPLGFATTSLTRTLLTRLANQYDLPEIARFSTYDSICEDFSNLQVGKSYGYSCFLHRQGQPFDSTDEHNDHGHRNFAGQSPLWLSRSAK